MMVSRFSSIQRMEVEVPLQRAEAGKVRDRQRFARLDLPDDVGDGGDGHGREAQGARAPRPDSVEDHAVRFISPPEPAFDGSLERRHILTKRGCEVANAVL